MTGHEYMDALYRTAPKSVPDHWMTTAAVILSRASWTQSRGDLIDGLRVDYAGGERKTYLCCHRVGVVETPGIEQLVPDSDALAFLRPGDYFTTDGELMRVKECIQERRTVKRVEVEKLGPIKWI